MIGRPNSQRFNTGMIVLSAICMGLLARAWVIWTAPGHSFAVDQLFDTLAWNLVILGRFTLDGVDPAAHVAPLYPAVLASFYFLVGHRPDWVPMLHILFDLGAAWSLYRVGTALWDSRVGAWTASIVFLYPAYWTYDPRIRSEALLTLLISVWLWTVVRSAQVPSSRQFTLMGLAAGLTILCKPVVLVLAVVLMAFIWIDTDQLSQRVKYGVVYGATCLVLVLPWSVRNYMSFHHIIPVSAGVGAGLWMGSDPSSRGSWPMSQEQEQAIWESAGITPLPYAYAMYDVSTDQLLRRKGVDRIVADPLNYAALTCGRIWDFWVGNAYYLSDEGQGFMHGLQKDLKERNLAVATYSLVKRLLLVPGLIVLACFSAWVHREHWKTLLPLYLFPIGLTAGYVPFTVEAGRYALPVLPCLMMLSVAAVPHFRMRRAILQRRPVSLHMTSA